MAIKLRSLSHDGVHGPVKALQANIRSCKQQNTELQECHEMVHHVVKHFEKQPESTHLLLSLVPRPPFNTAIGKVVLVNKYLCIMYPN